MVKLFHWKTHSYATHKATDELYDKLKVWEVKNKYNIDLSSTKLIDYISQLQGAFNQNPINILTTDGLVFLEKIFNKK